MHLFTQTDFRVKGHVAPFLNKTRAYDSLLTTLAGYDQEMTLVALGSEVVGSAL